MTRSKLTINASYDLNRWGVPSVMWSSTQYMNGVPLRCAVCLYFLVTNYAMVTRMIGGSTIACLVGSTFHDNTKLQREWFCIGLFTICCMLSFTMWATRKERERWKSISFLSRFRLSDHSIFYFLFDLYAFNKGGLRMPSRKLAAFQWIVHPDSHWSYQEPSSWPSCHATFEPLGHLYLSIEEKLEGRALHQLLRSW